MVSKRLWSSVCHHPRHCWPGSPQSEVGLAQRCSVFPPDSRCSVSSCQAALSLYQMPSPTHTEHRLSPDSANPTRPEERTRISIALGSPSFLTSLPGDSPQPPPHACEVLALPTPYLMHTARPAHPQALSYMFIQSLSLIHLFPVHRHPRLSFAPSHTLLSPRSPRRWGDPSPGPCNQALPQGCTATSDLTPKVLY